MDKQITEGNILISEFMGPHYESTFAGKGRMRLYVGKRLGRANYEAHELEYHESFDWLMPVIEKIESLPTNKDGGEEFQFSITGDGISITRFDDGSGVIAERVNHIGLSKLMPTWEVVIEFIKWYNQK